CARKVEYCIGSSCYDGKISYFDFW
nr:immunoglobulin heavy chain junction region [Macaca mulatta]MOX94778.1 immunoglobulin heavy chain junction region [Macaca mulatta]